MQLVEGDTEVTLPIFEDQFWWAISSCDVRWKIYDYVYPMKNL